MPINKTDSYLAIIKEARQFIFNGLNKTDSLRNNEIEIFLELSSIRALLLTDAIIELCKQGFSSESLAILRPMIETSVNMRWIMKQDTSNRISSYMAALDDPYGSFWTVTSLKKRMIEIGFSKEYYNLIVKRCHDFIHGNASSLPFDFVDFKKYSPVHPNAVLIIVAQMLAHVLTALNSNWSECFSEYSTVFEKLKRV